LKEGLQEHQAKKKRAERIILLGLPFLGFGILAAVLGTTEALGEWAVTVGVVLIIFAVLVFVLGFALFQRFETNFKHEFLKDYLSGLVEEGEFVPQKGFGKIQGLDPADVYNTEFIERADRFYSYDFFRGKIDGVDFVSSDVKLQRIEYETYRDKDGKIRRRKKYVTYFHGRVFHFDFNKDFDGHVLVLERYKPQTRRKYQKVEFESVDFNKKFRTLATREHTAFYILTPHFMESLMKIEKNHPGNLGFSFIDNKLYFAIHTGKPTFSVRPFRRLDEKLLEKFREDVGLIHNLVDELKLNRKIFKED